MSDKESESETTITQTSTITASSEVTTSNKTPENDIVATTSVTASSEVTISNKTPENDIVATTSVTIPISKISEAAPSLNVEAPTSESEVVREESNYSPPPILESEIGGPSEEARSTPSEEGKESSSRSSNDPTPQTSETPIIASQAIKVNPKNLSPSPNLNMAPSSLPTSSARSTPALTSTIPAVPSPKSLPAPSPKPSTFTPSPKPSPLAPSPKPMSHAASPKPAMTMPTVYPKPTVSITTTTITAPVATAGKSSSTTTLTSTTTENKEISIVPKTRKRSSPKKKNEPKQANPPKSQFSSPEQQMNGAGSNAGQIMYVPVANSMNVPLMTMGLQGNGMQFMPMFAVRPAGQGNNAGAQFIQMMPNGMFAMQQTQQQPQPQQQQAHQGQQQPRLIAPATVKDAVSPTKTTAPKSIESKIIRPAEHQNSTNQQTLVPVQVPGGNLCFQMSAPGGINSYPRALVKVQGPSIQSKQTNIQPAPVKPIQPKLPTMNDKDAGRRMPTSTQPQLQPRPVMVQTSGGQPQVSVASVMSQQNAMANFLSQQNFIPGMAGTIRLPMSAAQMNTMTANGMPRMILAQPPVSNANGTGKNQMGNTMQFMQQQGIPNLIPMHGIFPGNAQVMAQMGMTTIPTSTTTNGFTHLPSTSSMSMPTTTTKVPARKRKAEAIGPNDPNMSVKEYITMSKDPGKLKMEQQHKEEMGPPPVLDAAEDGALAPPVLKPVGEDEENEPPTLLRDEQSDNGINNIFIKEAEMMRKKKSETGENGPIIHFIDGFKIEEDVKPFPIEQQAILEAFESKLKPSSSFKEAQAFKKPGRKPSQKTLLTKEKMLEIKTEAEKEEQKVVKKKPGLKEILKRIDPKSCKSPSPPKSMKGRPPMSKQKSEDSIDKKERKKPGPKPRVRDASKSIDEEPPEKKPKTTVQQALAKKIVPTSPTKPSTSKEVEKTPEESQEKHLIKKKPKRRELEGLLNMDFGPEKSPFPTLKVDEYKQKVLEESLNLRPKSEEKERPGTRSHESSTTSLPNDYISKSDSYDNNFLESNVNTLEISPILGQEERRCRNCHKVLPQRPPNEGGFIQYCPKDSIKNCRKEFKRKQKRLAHLENSLSSSSPGAGDVDGSYLYDIRKRSSNGSNSNHPYEKRWSSTGSISFFGEQLQQQPSCSTPPNLQRSPLPSPLVCNKSPTSMTIKLRPSPNEPEASTSTGNVQNQQMFQNPGMIPSQGRPSWGQGQPQPIQQARTSTPAQNDDMERALEYNQLMEKEVTEWTPNDVARWVNWVVRSDAVGEVFIQEEIDGNALLMLSTEHYESLKKQYNLKMGPSIKLQGALRELKQVYGME